MYSYGFWKCVKPSELLLRSTHNETLQLEREMRVLEGLWEIAMEGPISNLGLVNDVGSGLALTSKKFKKKNVFRAGLKKVKFVHSTILILNSRSGLEVCWFFVLFMVLVLGLMTWYSVWLSGKCRKKKILLCWECYWGWYFVFPFIFSWIWKMEESCDPYI